MRPSAKAAKTEKLNGNGGNLGSLTVRVCERREL
jgi:hypothetical protein